MKKIILAAALFISCFSFSQIKVIETTPIIRLGSIGQNDIFIQTEGNKYTIFYKNVEKEDSVNLQSFSFKDLNNDYENLHKIIVDGFLSDPLLDIKLELPNEFVWLHYSKELGQTFVQFMSKNKKSEITGVTKAFNTDQINKLFEKKLTKKGDKDEAMSEFK
jgi:hypothetical protein